LGTRAGEEILSIAEETMRLREGNSKSWATAAGNYTTYLLDYGRYEEVLVYSDSVLAICRQVDGGINPSEAYAVRAEALQQAGSVILLLLIPSLQEPLN